MKEFMLIFRRDPSLIDEDQRSPEKMQMLWKAWRDWSSRLTAQNNFGENGKRLSVDGMVVRPKKPATNGPYVELKETVVGYMFIKANSLQEAAKLAEDCPQISMGGTVEIRPVVSVTGT